MKRNAIVCALVAMSLTMTGPAFAQAEGNQEDQQRTFNRIQRAQQHGQRGNDQRGPRGQSPQAQRAPRGYNPQAQRADRNRYERGAGPDHRFYPGDRLPPEYRYRSYVVDDWRGHHLSAPPRGYHWVQTGSDYVLVAIATGIILELLLNN